MSPITLPLLAALALPGADPAPRRYDIAKRASEIDPRAKEHPEIDFVFKDKAGKVQDLQHAAVDTRVPARGQLVIWLMGHNQALFDRLAGYGCHAVHVHYANKWFNIVGRKAQEDGTSLGKVRLEAATGEDHSPLVDVPKPDGMEERATQFVRWLAKNHPEGKWGQFLDDSGALKWELVTVSGSSHGSTTSARYAVHRKVGRVVMFCGPRDQYETWQGFSSATPPERFFGFSHVLDGGWTGHHYCRSWELLGLTRFGPQVDVDKEPAPYRDSRQLVTACDVGGKADKAHGVVTPGGGAAKGPGGKFLHEDVWKYLYTHPVGAVGSPAEKDPGCRVAPPK